MHTHTHAHLGEPLGVVSGDVNPRSRILQQACCTLGAPSPGAGEHPALCTGSPTDPQEEHGCSSSPRHPLHSPLQRLEQMPAHPGESHCSSLSFPRPVRETQELDKGKPAGSRDRGWGVRMTQPGVRAPVPAPQTTRWG